MESVGLAERAERMLILAVVSHNCVLLVARLRLRNSLVGGAFKLDSYTKSTVYVYKTLKKKAAD